MQTRMAAPDMYCFAYNYPMNQALSYDLPVAIYGYT